MVSGSSSGFRPVLNLNSSTVSSAFWNGSPVEPSNSSFTLNPFYIESICFGDFHHTLAGGPHLRRDPDPQPRDE
jgi:hypothetical protein